MENFLGGKKLIIAPINSESETFIMGFMLLYELTKACWSQFINNAYWYPINQQFHTFSKQLMNVMPPGVVEICGRVICDLQIMGPLKDFICLKNRENKSFKNRENLPI